MPTLAVDALARAQATGQRAKPEVPDKTREAAQEFEAFFLAQVLNHMFAGISTEGRFGGGPAEGVYRKMINDEYAKVISRSGGIGVADAVYREMLRLQEIE